MTVTYDGTYSRMISGGDVDSIPALSDMITPGMEIVEDVTGAENDTLPENTVVKEEAQTAGTTTDSNEIKSPQTGDVKNFVPVVMMLLASAFVLSVSAKKKQEN